MDRFIKHSKIIWSQTENIFYSNEDYNQYIRQITLLHIVPNKLKKIEGSMVDEINLLCSKFEEFAKSGEPCDPIRLMKLCSFNIIFRLLFSIHYPYVMEKNSSNNVIDFIESTLGLAGQSFASDYLHFLQPLFGRTKASRDYIESNRSIGRFLDTIIDERLKSKHDYSDPVDILDLYIIEYKANKITKNALTYVFFDLLLAATDTSSNTGSALIKVVCNQPEVQEKLYQELNTFIKKEPTLSDKNSTPYANAVIRETLRRFPVVPLGIPHQATKDCYFKGYFIKEGTQIIQNINGSMLSDEFWDDPMSFKPERFLGESNQKNVSRVKSVFGSGTRNCLGTSLAEYELYLWTAIIFKRFKFTRLTEEKIDDSMTFGLTSMPYPFKAKVELR
ncbi:cytochrome P450 family protein [Heterostelium album PN500]|uniref:Cytochrome P450 family protein n=1 Tax=Heterostelium pallidum (strain ATCC 26659 / Pp 5 / PN500) TaxID=670386 RepID=D3AZI7_HETP5|nr:cytochrome P450 family protein [Heterostelium album PN500]EFA85366.1 cytochrome P450 family protein [Heterostelium album PN500]|eukprot:XP_020437475.1 cytochrome P450 family protein [Heterostelium album PN500]